MNIYFYPNDALTSADKPINAEQVFQTSKGKVYTAINLLNGSVIINSLWLGDERKQRTYISLPTHLVLKHGLINSLQQYVKVNSELLSKQDRSLIDCLVNPQEWG